jgi:hypothetical protein
MGPLDARGTHRFFATRCRIGVGAPGKAPSPAPQGGDAARRRGTQSPLAQDASPAPTATPIRELVPDTRTQVYLRLRNWYQLERAAS